MADHPVFRRRSDRGWSQEELARRSGLSRPEVSAIETRRVVPSVKAALAVSRALGATVEELFDDGVRIPPTWAWEPRSLPSRAWLANVGGRVLAIPCEPGLLGLAAHDVVVETEPSPTSAPPEPTLVVAGCDPAVGLLGEVMRGRGVRVVAVTRSSSRALELLEQGRVHVAGVHLGHGRRAQNGAAVRARLGKGYGLVRWAEWEEGVATVSGAGIGSLETKRLARLRWVGREEGSGAKSCMDELFQGHRAPRCDIVAADHREVAQIIRMGVADAGVCVRVTADEAGLGFHRVRTEAYDLCFRSETRDDPAIRALCDVLRSRSFRRLLAELPGYTTKNTGETLAIT